MRGSDAAAAMRVRMAVRQNTCSDPSRLPLDLIAHHVDDIGRGWLIEDDDGVLRAFAIAHREPDGRGSIWALFVEPGFEGRGWGRRLMDEAEAWLRAAGLTPAWLCTEPGTRAESFYTARGWRPGGMKHSGDREFTWS